MYKHFFSNLQSVTLPLFAMGVFVSAFLLMLARTFLFKRTSDFDPLAALPLNDEPSKEAKP
ncbi:MAG: CcoQ/FixQ family Cbb3-type cytochrome c oxidase assembly chaperone [Myxococcaceae bacterium]|jgi:cytochrome c oxidase cbb3-type subunit 4|nr:CcoQ/FixQ family Cbb3-type cytochrome c oxidase assembly chaperone [Myxococcaceae bacterium]MCA3014136.1 CcoQ/FixQ family Cbb3-type cytochrome c oxidase assembly chaperone [Myxococcaceae bacterium]